MAPGLDGRAVDSVEVEDVQIQAIDLEEAWDGLRELVRATMVSVHESAGDRPPRVVMRAACVQGDITGRRLVEVSDDQQVAHGGTELRSWRITDCSRITDTTTAHPARVWMLPQDSVRPIRSRNL